MAPAVECTGCEVKAKIASNTVSDQEMSNLFNWAAGHVKKQVDLRARPWQEGDPHFPEFKFYLTTPEEGFENATVVGR